MCRSDHNYAAARKLRRNLSLPEVLLWRIFKHTDGIKLRKQHPVGHYVIDFYCAAAKLGIEIDGIAHDMGDRPMFDRERDAFIGAQGISIIRISAREVLADVEAAAESIIVECRKRIG